MKWVYAFLAILVLSVIGLEMNSRNKISELRAKVEGMQKELDSRYVPSKAGESFPKYFFDEQELCNKGAVPRLVKIDMENNFKYYDNYEIATDMDKSRLPDYTGKVNIEKRKLRIFIKENQQFKLRHYGYIYDWDENGRVKGIETREENFHVDYCNGEDK